MASLDVSIPDTRTPSPDPSVIARDFASRAEPKTFFPRNMPVLPVKYLYLDYTPASSPSRLAWLPRRKASNSKDFKHVRLLVLDKPPTKPDAQGYSISLHASTYTESNQNTAPSEDAKKDYLHLVEAFAFYSSSTAAAYEQKIKGTLFAGPTPGNWQEPVGITEAKSEVIAREARIVYKHYVQCNYDFTPENCRLFCSSVANCIQTGKPRQADKPQERIS